jgi:hypothetical protein
MAWRADKAPLAASLWRKAVKVSGTCSGGMGRESGANRVDCHRAVNRVVSTGVVSAPARIRALVPPNSLTVASRHSTSNALRRAATVACSSGAAMPSATNWLRCGPWRAKPQGVSAVVCAGSSTTTGSSQVWRWRASCRAWVSAGLSCRRRSCLNQNTTPPGGHCAGQPAGWAAALPEWSDAGADMSSE